MNFRSVSVCYCTSAGAFNSGNFTLYLKNYICYEVRAKLCVSVCMFTITCTSQKHAQFFIPMLLVHFQHFSIDCFVRKVLLYTF